MSRPCRILIVDDVPNWRTALTRLLKSEDYELNAVASHVEAKSALDEHFYHLTAETLSKLKTKRDVGDHSLGN